MVLTQKSRSLEANKVLDVNAPPFYPSFYWHPHITEDYYKEHPCQKGGNGFVIADSCMDNFNQLQLIPDEELFDPKFHPLSQKELDELDMVDQINELFAELDMMETHEELHFRVHQKAREKRTESDVEAEIRSLLNKASAAKQARDTRHTVVKNPKLNHRKMDLRVQQPRASH